MRNMGLMDWIGGNQHRQSGEGGGKDEDVGKMIEKWTGRLLSGQRGQMVRVRMPVSPLSHFLTFHSEAATHSPHNTI